MLSEALRPPALALRDLVEITGADEGTLEFDGLIVTYSEADGFHAVPREGDPVEITDWIEWTGLVPADGVESVRDQFVTRATAAGAE